MFLTAGLALVAACGTTPDERPLTLEVVTLSVLAPTCGQVQCHSTTTKTVGYAFDTVDASSASLKALHVNDPDYGYFGGGLFQAIHGDGLKRMPPDGPLSDQDYDFLTAWVAAGTPTL
jgi:cytochrome c551/c552